MADLVIDTNIVISALITPNNRISRIIFQDLIKSKNIALQFLLTVGMDRIKAESNQVPKQDSIKLF
jgi:predicted nucleic acid-binding protein